MGKSRSVTITIAYLLRQNPEHTVSSALELIRESRPMAEPNDGFMKQLELYKEMGCPRDIDGHPKYQRWLYRREVDLALAAGMAPDRVRFEDEEAQDESDNVDKEIELRCRKCRYLLSFMFGHSKLTTSSSGAHWQQHLMSSPTYLFRPKPHLSHRLDLSPRSRPHSHQHHSPALAPTTSSILSPGCGRSSSKVSWPAGSNVRTLSAVRN